MANAFLLAFVDVIAKCSVTGVARVAIAVDRANRVTAKSICVAVVKSAFVDISAFYFSISFVSRVTWAVESTRKVDTRSKSHAGIVCTFINVLSGLQIIRKYIPISFPFNVFIFKHVQFYL